MGAPVPRSAKCPRRQPVSWTDRPGNRPRGHPGDWSSPIPYRLPCISNDLPYSLDPTQPSARQIRARSLALQVWRAFGGCAARARLAPGRTLHHCALCILHCALHTAPDFVDSVDSVDSVDRPPCGEARADPMAERFSARSLGIGNTVHWQHWILATLLRPMVANVRLLPVANSSSQCMRPIRKFGRACGGCVSPDPFPRRAPGDPFRCQGCLHTSPGTTPTRFRSCPSPLFGAAPSRRPANRAFATLRK